LQHFLGFCLSPPAVQVTRWSIASTRGCRAALDLGIGEDDAIKPRP
jgi:hypothetical protein